MPYSNDELNKAIEKIVRSSVRFDYGPIGQRRTSLSFGDLQDAAAGIFCRFDGAPFYLARLAADRLNELVSSMATFIDEMVSTAMATSRYVGPVERLGGLANARVALTDLVGAGGERKGAFSSIEDVPAYRRFEKGTSNWLAKEGVKVRAGGGIAQTPPEAQARLRKQAMDLREQHDEVLRRVEHLQGCIAEYEALNLPATLAGSIIENSAKVLEAHLKMLEALNPEQRTAKIREVTLDVMAARACVKGFGSLSPVGLFARLTGFGAPFYNSSHPATPASLLGLYPEPYNFYEGHQNVALVVDNAGSTRVDVTVQMPSSFVPFISGAARNPVTIAPPAVAFKVELVGSAVPEDTVVITPGTYQLYELAEEINNDTGSSLESYIRLLGGITTIADALAGVDIVFRVPGSDDLPLPSPAPLTWVQQGVVVGDYVLVIDRASPGFRTVWQVTAFQVGNYEMVCSSLSGASFVGDEVAVEIGDASLQMLTIGAAYSTYENALNGMWQLKLTDVVPNGLSRIGFQPTTVTARQSKAVDVAAAVNTSPTSRDEFGAARIQASAPFTAVFTGKARTVQADSSKLYVYWARGEATISSIVPGVINSTVIFSLGDTDDWSDVAAGDTLVIRETEVIGDVDKALTITSVDLINLAMSATIATASVPAIDGLPLIVETVKPSEVIYYNFSTVIIGEDLPVAGEYEAARYSSATPGLITLATPMVYNLHVGFGGLPIFMNELQWGYRQLVITSLNNTLSSYLQMRHTKLDVENPPALIPVPDDGSDELIVLTAEAYASTPWFSLPGRNPPVEVGDVLELYSVGALSPTSVHPVVAGESSFQVVKVDPPVDMPQSSIPFTAGSQVPFGRVRKSKVQNFGDMRTLLQVWARRPEADFLRFFRALDSAVNIVVSSRRPTTGQVGALVNHLQDLKTALVGGAGSLEAALAVYTAKVVEQVDALLKGYRDKGADRAADILEEGRFSEFFGLTMDGSSYGGRLQETLKAAARELPVRKTGRQSQLNAGEEQLIASFEDVDLEYAQEELEVGDRLAIPEASDVLPAGLPQP